MRLLDVWLYDRLVTQRGLSLSCHDAKGTVPFVSRMLHDVAVEQRQSKAQVSVGRAVRHALLNEPVAVGVELVGTHPRDLANISHPAALCRRNRERNVSVTL